MNLRTRSGGAVQRFQFCNRRSDLVALRPKVFLLNPVPEREAVSSSPPESLKRALRAGHELATVQRFNVASTAMGLALSALTVVDGESNTTRNARHWPFTHQHEQLFG
jgi:hypothetical protein